jgi:hypothetical protein
MTFMKNILSSDLKYLRQDKGLPEEPKTTEPLEDKYPDTKKPFPEYKEAKKKQAGGLMERMQQNKQQEQGNAQQLASLLNSAVSKFRSLVFEVSGTEKVIEVTKAGNNLNMKVFEEKDSPTPSSEKTFQMPEFINFFMQKLAPRNPQQVAQELSNKGIAEVSKGSFACVRVAMKKANMEKYYTPEGELSDEPMFLVSKTYEIWDEEAMEAGDTDDKGYEFQDQQMSPAELEKELVSEPYGEWSNSTGTGWINTIDRIYDRDYFEKGVEKKYALHFKKLDGSELEPEDYAFINKLLKGGR